MPITTRTGMIIDLSAAKSSKVDECKREATKHINDIVPAHRRENISLWGSGYSITKEQLGSFITSVTSRCDTLESQINASNDPGSVSIDYSDITI